MPGFTMDYDVDPVKKEIAESWPNFARRHRPARSGGGNPNGIRA